MWPGKTAKIGARWPPTWTQTPANTVGIFPFTRSAAPTCFAVPAGAKLDPKTEAMAFGESTFTAGTLSPARTTPRLLMNGAVDEGLGVMVSVNVALALMPADDAVIVTA